MVTINNHMLNKDKCLRFNKLCMYMAKKDSLLQQCVDILKTSDVRNEIKQLFSPVTDLILYEIYPYIYIIIFLVFLMFMQLFAILGLLIYTLKYRP